MSGHGQVNPAEVTGVRRLPQSRPQQRTVMACSSVSLAAPCGCGVKAPIQLRAWNRWRVDPLVGTPHPALRDPSARALRTRRDRRSEVQKQGSVIPEKGEEVRTFDEAVVRVRSGRGGDGELAERGKGRYVRNFKYRPGRNDPKQIWLPDSKPADGEDGGDVVVYCDPACQSLLHLSDKEVLVAPSGANGNPADGSRGPKRRVGGRGKAPALKVPVPPGTAVLRGGKRLAELVRPGDSVVVARGGMGGSGVVGQSREQRARDRARQAEAETRGEVVVNDVNWRADARGQAGEQATLKLVLRVVADVGLVGLPNAGKSSLLKAVTKASPAIADYPFTTLTPNLGVSASTGATLADLPGLIGGAHHGRGLGRNFLRHLRRARVVLHVVDASAEDPVADYRVIRDELRMYNPEYVMRPHIVCLNKIDLAGVPERLGEVEAGIRRVAVEPFRLTKGDVAEDVEPKEPVAVVAISAFAGLGLDELQVAIRETLGTEEADNFDLDFDLESIP